MFVSDFFVYSLPSLFFFQASFFSFFVFPLDFHGIIVCASLLHLRDFVWAFSLESLVDHELVHFFLCGQLAQSHVLLMFVIVIDGQDGLAAMNVLHLDPLVLFGLVVLEKTLEFSQFVQSSSAAGNNFPRDNG